MYKPESVQANETHTILLNFETQADQLIPARWQDMMIVDKKPRQTTE